MIELTQNCELVSPSLFLHDITKTKCVICELLDCKNEYYKGITFSDCNSQCELYVMKVNCFVGSFVKTTFPQKPVVTSRWLISGWVL